MTLTRIRLTDMKNPKDSHSKSLPFKLRDQKCRQGRSQERPCLQTGLAKNLRVQ